MSPYNKFKSLVFTLTTASLFLCWVLIQPIIESTPITALLFGGLISFGAYRLILNICHLLLLKCKFIKKMILGNLYMEGTWVGCYISLNSEPVFYIENFEQTIDALIIRGRCYHSNNSFKGSWTSTNVIINEKEGIMRYTYETDMVNNLYKNQGIAIFNFVRTEKNSAPKALIGYASDIFKPMKIKSLEEKINDCKKISNCKNFDDTELLKKAQDLFNRNKAFFSAD